LATAEHLEDRKTSSDAPGAVRRVAEWVCFGYRRVPEHEKEKLVLHHFNTVARKYDRMNTLLSFGLHHLWKRSAIKMLGLKPGDRVLDVCGGTADLAILAARAVGLTGRVIVYDINRAMVHRGKSKADRNRLSDRIHFVRGDAECISLPQGPFDAAMVGFGIRNLTHPNRGFEEMHRVLRNGGRFMCLEFSEPTASLFRRLYDCYSFHIMPLAGELLAGSRRAYTYLPESIRTFPRPEQLAVTLREIGFAGVTYRKLTNGIAVIHVGVKPR
jgi:demethylmenaquinone methyltransferase/2-methoxy-6-polyprenyl-1,4-benzoquinol methylase